MKNYFLISILSCLFYFPLLSQNIAGKGDTSIPAKLDEYLTSLSNAYKFSGSVLVAREGKILFQKGYGWKNAATHTRNDEYGIFQIGSLTKPFTAAVILKLQEQGKLSVHDKLSAWLPDYPRGNEISIENLLTHTSGIPGYDVEEKDTLAWTPVSKAGITTLFKDLPLEFRPGAQYAYSNSGYFLLGMIIEKVTGKPYEQVVREMIFEPLQMSHSGFDFIHLRDTLKVTGYAVYQANRQRPVHLIDSTVSYATGGMYSNVIDLYKWGRSISTNSLLSANSWKKAFMPFTPGYGYGWFIDSMYGRRYVAHSGGIMGFTSYFVYFPAEDIDIILLNNFLDERGIVKLPVQDISAILFNKPYMLYQEAKEIKIEDSLMNRYTGTYTLANAPKRTMIVTIKNEHLQAALTGKTILEFVFLTNTRFQFKNVTNAAGEFIVENGEVQKMVISQNGQYEWNKVK